MAGIPLVIGSTGSSGPPGSRFSCFVRTNTVLTHRTVLVDIDASPLGYLHLIFNPTPTTGEGSNFVAEASYRGARQAVTLTPTGFVFEANHWYWISVYEGGHLGSGSGWKWGLGGQVWDAAGGGTPGLQVVELDLSAVVGLPPTGWDTVDCGLGWGVPLSSSDNPFPNAAGDNLAELCIETSPTMGTAGGPLGIPAHPLTPSSTPYVVALYHCDEPIGTDRTVHDACANHYDLTPGPNHDQIVADSPFA